MIQLTTDDAMLTLSALTSHIGRKKSSLENFRRKLVNAISLNERGVGRMYLGEKQRLSHIKKLEYLKGEIENQLIDYNDIELVEMSFNAHFENSNINEANKEEGY